MSDHISVSIIMPLFNGFEFLKRSIESIKSQTYPFWELIIGINGHDENSYEYIETLLKYQHITDNGYGSVYVIRYDQKGKVETSNKMINECKFDTICILNVDDYWSSDKLEKQIEVWKLNKYDVVGTFCRYFGDKDISPPVPAGELNNNLLFNGNVIINSSAMLKKCDAKWTDRFTGLDDYDMWFRLAYEDKKFYNIPEILTYIHKQSAFNSNNNYVKSLKDYWRKIYDEKINNEKINNEKINNIKISVICPSYDRFDYLQEAIKSIKMQTFPIHEIIIINDGSTDKRYYSNFDSDIKILHLNPSSREIYGRPNIAYTLNYGIERAEGNYIARIDDDDLWLPNKLELQVQKMLKSSCKLSSTEGYIAFRRWGKYNLEEHLESEFYRNYKLHNADFAASVLRINKEFFSDIWKDGFIDHNNFVIHSSVIFEKELFYKVGKYITDYYQEDWNLWKRMLKVTNLCYIKEPCFVYHKN
jgi:glycosyltransferase involved in cell wall biosynthesis